MQQKSAACSGKKMGKAAATTATKRPDIGKCGTDIFLGAPLKKVGLWLKSTSN